MRLRNTSILCGENGPLKMKLHPIPQSEWFVVERRVDVIKGNTDPDTGAPFIPPKEE